MSKQVDHETSAKRRCAELPTLIHTYIHTHFKLSVLLSRRWGMWLLNQFISKSKADYNEYLLVLLKYILTRCAVSIDVYMYVCMYVCMYVRMHVSITWQLKTLKIFGCRRRCISYTQIHAYIQYIRMYICMYVLYTVYKLRIFQCRRHCISFMNTYVRIIIYMYT